MTDEIKVDEDTTEAIDATIDAPEAATTTDDKALVTTDATAKVDEKPTLADAVNDAVEEATQGRRIQPKAEEVASEDTRPRNADGTFKKETAEEITAREAADAAKAAETPEQKTAREAAEAAAAAAKKPDDINDPIPAGLNKRTAERMKYLIETVTAQKSVVESHTALFDAVQQAGTPEEFASMIGYMKGVKSNDPATLETCYTVLKAELRGLAVRMGKPLYEVNLLREESNKDLVTEIAEGKITNQRAHEVALMRERQSREGATRTAQVTTQTTEQTAAADREFGIADMNKYEEELIAKDGPIARQKIDELLPFMKPAFKRLNPRTWRTAFAEAYADYKPAPKAAAVVPQATQRTVPQRPKSPAGGGTATAAKSALDAINSALEGF